MTNRFDVASLEDEDLSALADGELGTGAAARICGRWRDEPALQERWHDYHLIGDVMRSEDLASPSTHDRDFLAALRTRMAAEPIVIAPARTDAEPAVAVSDGLSGKTVLSRRRVASVGAIAAGFVVVVAGALTLFGQSIPGLSPAAPAAELAQAAPGVTVAVRSPGRVDPASEPQPTVASGQLIRDAKLDSYLSAHRQWSDGAMLGGHAAYLRYHPGDGSTR